MTRAREAYLAWKNYNRVDMQVRTDEQMFVIGYDMAMDEVGEVADLVTDLLEENKVLKEELECLKPKQEKVTAPDPLKTENSSVETGTESSKKPRKKVDKKALMSL